MGQTVVNVGEYNQNWKLWIVVWLLVVIILALATPVGFLTTITGTAGLFFVFHGILAVRRSFSSKSVNKATIGALGGNRKAVQIVGDAQSVDEPFTAPLTDSDCVAWELRVKEWSPSDEEGL